MGCEESIRKMRIEKSIRHKDMPIEVCKCMEERGIVRIRNLFNNLKTKSKPDDWRKSTIFSLYKNKRYSACANNSGIMLLSHRMKFVREQLDKIKT